MMKGVQYERLSMAGLVRGSEEYRRADAENHRRKAEAERNSKGIRCKKCKGELFADLSALRKHQWEKHREQFDNIKKALVNRAKRRKALAKLEPALNGKGPMLASELLAQLQSQQKFLNDIVSLVSGIINQHEVSK